MMAKKVKAKTKKAGAKEAAPKTTTTKKKATKKAVASKPAIKKVAAKKPAAKKAVAVKPVAVKPVVKVEKTRLVRVAAEMPTIIPIEVLIEHAIQTEDPLRRFDKHAFSKATSKGDPHSKIHLNTKSKRPKLPSSKKPLWRK